MNKLLAHRCHTAANRLIRESSIEFTYQVPMKPKQGRLKGTYRPTWSNPIKIFDPLVPVNSQSANSLVNAQDGTANQYQFIWISHKRFPMKTRVTHDKQQFTVINRASYQHIAGVFVYYLKGRSDVNGI